MRDQNGVDLAGIDAGRLHVGQQLSGCGLNLAAGAAVAQDGLAAVFDDDDSEGNGDEIRGQSCFHHCGFHIVDRSIPDEGGIMGLFPDSVIIAVISAEPTL